jgi:hypothetical protein
MTTTSIPTSTVVNIVDLELSSNYPTTTVDDNENTSKQ